MNVLLIEDNELNRDMLKRRLERNEFTVICAENGEIGLNMAQNYSPDIIVEEKILKLLVNDILFGDS